MIKLLTLLKELTMNAMYSKTPTRYRERAMDISVKLKTVRHGAFYYQTFTRSNGNVHKQVVKPLPDKKNDVQLVNKNDKLRVKTPVKLSINGVKQDVVVHCDCNDFKYENEWLLWKNNASRIVNSNGQPLNVKNPERLTKFCKHLSAVMIDFKRQMSK